VLVVQAPATVTFGVFVLSTITSTGAPPVARPITGRVVPPPPVNATLVVFVPAAVGLYRTTTATVWLAVRLYGLPDTTENGAATLALPLSVPPPTFCTWNTRLEVAPTVSVPKSKLDGVTAITGVGGASPTFRSLTASAITYPPVVLSVRILTQPFDPAANVFVPNRNHAFPPCFWLTTTVFVLVPVTISTGVLLAHGYAANCAGHHKYT
jgi:hypothetical protein